MLSTPVAPLQFPEPPGQVQVPPSPGVYVHRIGHRGAGQRPLPLASAHFLSHASFLAVSYGVDTI